MFPDKLTDNQPRIICRLNKPRKTVRLPLLHVYGGVLSTYCISATHVWILTHVWVQHPYIHFVLELVYVGIIGCSTYIPIDIGMCCTFIPKVCSKIEIVAFLFRTLENCCTHTGQVAPKVAVGVRITWPFGHFSRPKCQSGRVKPAMVAS